MTTLGYILFIIATITIFGSDRLYKQGRITTVKELLRVKTIGTGLLLISVIFMIIGNK